MRTTFDHRSARGHTLAAKAWPGAAVALASLLPMLAGCQTASPWAKRLKGQTGSAQASKSETALPKNDFHREVTQDQQFNMHLEFGRVLESEKQYESAIAEYQKALEACARRGLGSGVKGSGAKQALAHRRMGGALDRLGRFSQSEAHYQLALKASPDDANVWNDSGYSYYMQSRWVDSERNLKTAAKLAPDNVRIQTNLGLTLAAVGKTDEALVALSKAGGNAIGHANLGYLLAAMGQTDKAREHYETALQLQPNLTPARQALTALAAVAAAPKLQELAAAAGTAAASSDVKIERASTPQPAPLIVPLQTTLAPVPSANAAAPRPAPTLTPPLAAPRVAPPPPAATPVTMTPAAPDRRRSPTAKTSQGPRATPVALTPMYDRPASRAQSLSLAARARTNRPTTTATTPAPPPLPRIPTLSQASPPKTPAPQPLVASSPRKPAIGAPKAGRSGSDLTDSKLARVPLPPVYDPRTKPATKPAIADSKVARVSLPPVYDPRSRPVKGAATADPAVARTSLPPVYDPRTVSVPSTRDYNPRPLSGALPPIYDPRIKPVPRTGDSTSRSLPGLKPGSLPPVYDPRNPPVVSPGTTSAPISLSQVSPPK